MEPALLIALISRWLHIGSAIVAVGGSVFMRFVLMPAAAALPEAEHTALRTRIMGRWKKILHTTIALFLLTGFYNYLAVMAPLHKGDKLYHALLGIKILLAFVVFFLAIALTGRSNWSEMFRKDAKKWLAINIAIATVIVAISGYLKVRPIPPKPVPLSAPNTAE